ncbi:hypothetical protein Dimus_024658 [Dionaea muscipula]
MELNHTNISQCLALNGSQAYVKIDQETVARTSHKRDRVWNQTFQILCAHPSDSTITIAMKTNFNSGFFNLNLENGKPIVKLQLQLILWYKPVEYETSWLRQIKEGNFKGLKSARFPQRSNCGVTFYHDAHHLSTFKSPFDISRGGPTAPDPSDRNGQQLHLSNNNAEN